MALSRFLPIGAVLVALTGDWLAGPSGAADQTATSSTTPPVHRPSAVGSVSEVFVDTSRPTPPEGPLPGAPTRTLPTVVYYPAQGPSAGPVRPGARPLRQGGPYPLIMFSHGNSSSGPTYEPILRQWASQGYVVAAPTFPMSSHSQVADYVNQPKDVSFVLTRVLRLGALGRGPLAGLINATRIGVAGHSLGAITTLGMAFNSCCADPRVKAVVSISGIALPFPGGTYFSGRARPLLLLHGTADQEVPYQGSVQLFAQAQRPKFFVTLIGAPHTSFRQTDTEGHPAPPWESVDVRTVTDFFDAYLKGEKGAVARLRHDASVPGVASFQEAG